MIYISANDRLSVKVIGEAVRKAADIRELSPDLPVIINERQRAAAYDAFVEMDRALTSVNEGMTLDAVYISLDNALSAVARLSGENVSEAVLDEVFSKFCVGK